MRENEAFEIITTGGKGTLIAPHYHADAFEFIEVVRGSADVTVGLTTIHAPCGSILHLIPGFVHFAVAHGEEECFLRVLTYRRDAALTLDSLDERFFSLYLLPIENRATLFTAEHSLNARLARHMENVIGEWRGKEIFYTSLVLAEISHMQAAVLRLYGYREEETPEYRSMMRIAPTVEYVLENYASKLRLEEMAQKLFLSPDHFGKLFRQTVGLTPIEFVNNIRVSAAMRYLASTDWTISDISRSSGFANTNYFHKVFRDLVGIGPAALRKQWQAMKAETRGALS